MNQSSEVLIIDIGERFLKFLVVSFAPDNTFEYTYATQQPSGGIINGEVVNLRQLSEQIFKSLYKVEIDSGSSFNKVYICFSIGSLKSQVFQTTLDINGIIENKHIEYIRKELDFFCDDCIVDYLDYGYYVSNHKKQDPVGMFAKTLRYECQFVSCNKDLIVHLTLALKRINVELLGFGIGTVKVMNRLLLGNSILVDIGFSSTRIITNLNNKKQIHIINKGINHLLESLTVRNGKNIDQIEEILSISYKVGNFDMTESVRLFIFNLFSEVLDIISKASTDISKFDYEICLYGACRAIPLIDVFLRQKFDRNFKLLTIDCDINTHNNINCFINNYAYIKDITSKGEDINNVLSSSFIDLTKKIYQKL